MDSSSNRDLETAIWRLTLELRYESAAMRCMAALRRVGATLGKAGYDPNQPRDPAGTSTGGQWSGGGTSGGSGGTPFRSPDFYYFDLRAIESRRSHAWSNHVNKTPEALLSDILATARPWVNPDGSPTIRHQQSQGGFATEGEANRLVASVLREYPELVERAVQGDNRVQITHDFHYPTGIEAYWGPNDAAPIIQVTHKVRVLIAHDPTPGSRGYIVITAFPMRDVPNEVFK
ncbi:hypothetical protein ABIB57_002354 [Devosia sp. UYZn731]|uniref:RNase A-like domain-containing protein n=1 Tax=Devosia sp. UYZn731 TaxID=3156345 RepID=UPI00339316BF